MNFDVNLHHNVNMFKKYYKILFYYRSSNSNYKVRYIPVEEEDKCYFPICQSEHCPKLYNNTMHPSGIYGCIESFNPCINTDCPIVQYKHLSECHKKCIDNKGTYPLPPWKKRCITLRPLEPVYHFNFEDFDDQKK
jgi:hypothetical protein